MACGPTTRISSSTTNGIPPLRRYSASTIADDGSLSVAAAIAETIVDTSARVEAFQADLLHGVPALEPEDELATRLPTREVVGPVRRHQDEVGHGCWAMRSTTLALAASIQCRSSTTSTVGPRAVASATIVNTASARSSPDSPAGPSEATASSGRPIDPGCADTPIVVTRGGTAANASSTSRVLPMPGSPDTERDGRLVARHHLGGLDEPDETGVDTGPPDHHRAQADASAQHDGRTYRLASQHLPRARRRRSSRALADLSERGCRAERGEPAQSRHAELAERARPRRGAATASARTSLALTSR